VAEGDGEIEGQRDRETERQRTEVRSQKSEVRNQRAEIRGQRTEDKIVVRGEGDFLKFVRS